MSPDALAARLLGLLHRDDLDGAIEAGLAGFEPDTCATLSSAGRARLRQARDRLLAAWAARERHRARARRLARNAAELRARRAPPAAAAADGAARPLPAAAAAALERARQRARGGPA